ncbi:MAG: hypothetical protein I3270_00665 [Candidatus Moeniiplasma glomeromycotorum]|nr:hypothetical protein [Candidatus Moeniiplasma glomeromycotorum]MCE8162195.1 hypothetical protein [Candidatus Moeniiplasma glomeromycotorum]MCE8166149.1 hypothetical protein [Candidatus Moeniiplasma glomeromycotorum]MCE8166594.1 hypothetical protein [Candidatus Moeniiplasma glomeromycotorum]
MSDTETKHQSSSQKTDYSTLIYLLVWIILSGLLITGGVLVFNWWDRRQKIKDAKEWIHNVQDQKPDKESERKYEDTRGRVYHNQHRIKKFTTRIAENPKKFGIWQEDLDKISKNLTLYEELKQIKHDSEQLEATWLKVYQDSCSLTRLGFRLFSNQEIKQQWEDQEKWLEEKATQEEKEAEGKFKELMDYFYRKFLDELSPEEKTPWNIWPVKIEGKPANHVNLKAEINYIINKYNERLNFQFPTHGWKSFTGYDVEAGERNKEGSYTMGLTVRGPKDALYLPFAGDGDRDEFWYFEKPLVSEIRLKRELLFSRQNRYYTEWITGFDKEKDNWDGSLDISEDCLLNTIAHELAHAVINALQYHYGKDNGGHGDLHDDYTDKIEEMIKASPLYEKFMIWWREPQTKNG